MQAPDPHPHVTMFYAIWAAAGPLVGLVVGAWLQARGQLQQWRRDNVRQECRELLGQLSVNLFAFIDWNKSVRFPTDPETAVALHRQYDNAVLDLHRNLGSRILIANEIRGAAIAFRWKNALNNFTTDHDESKLNAEYEELVEDIVGIGLKV